MKILQRYILGLTLRNLGVSLSVFTVLFLILDFFDRIDNLMNNDAALWVSAQYFFYKIPLTLSLMFPVAMLVATIFTFGVLSKNSEIIAMRAAGLRLSWIAMPLFVVGLSLSAFSLVLNETIVPYATRRVKEIYNIDIKQKDKSGGFSQEDFWWRSGEKFFSVNMFDSRTNSLHGVSQFELSPNFTILRRTDADSVKYIDPLLGWSMKGVRQYDFEEMQSDSPSAALKTLPIKTKAYPELPLLIAEKPEEFYDSKTDAQTMSYFELKNFINQQKKNGIKVSGYRADLFAKIAFPFSIFIVTLAALPFSLKSARSGSMAGSLIASLVIGFTYYAVHSMSIAIGRAELWPAPLAAWMANILIGFVGVILNLGAEAP